MPQPWATRGCMPTYGNLYVLPEACIAPCLLLIGPAERAAGAVLLLSYAAPAAARTQVYLARWVQPQHRHDSLAHNAAACQRAQLSLLSVWQRPLPVGEYGHSGSQILRGSMQPSSMPICVPHRFDPSSFLPSHAPLSPEQLVRDDGCLQDPAQHRPGRLL